MTIATNKLCTISSLSLSDQLRVWDTSNADERKCTLSALVDFLQENLDLNGITTQYKTPSTGDTVSMTGTWLILTPVSTLATLTIELPATPSDQQSISVNSTQVVTALTVDGGDSTLIGMPTSLGSSGGFTARYDAVNTTWYRCK